MRFRTEKANSTSRGPAIKPRRGGLFIETGHRRDIFFVFRRRAAEKQKKKRWGSGGYYKQATPTGFQVGTPNLNVLIRAGFTLAEVLAALVFMAILIPVAIEGL